MDVDKIYKLHDLLNGRRTSISAQHWLANCNAPSAISCATIRFMRKQFSAPLDYDREYQAFVSGLKMSDDPWQRVEVEVRWMI